MLSILHEASVARQIFENKDSSAMKEEGKEGCADLVHGGTWGDADNAGPKNEGWSQGRWIMESAGFAAGCTITVGQFKSFLCGVRTYHPLLPSQTPP